MHKEAVRINEDMRIKLERYIVREGLHKYSVKLAKIASFIIKDLIDNPVLDKSKIIYGTANEPRTRRVTIYLTDDEYIKFYEIFVSDYVRDCRTPSILIYNIIKQFIEEKELD